MNDDLLYELNYPLQSSYTLIDSLLSNNGVIKPLDLEDIMMIDKNSSLETLRALYVCKGFEITDINLSNQQAKYQSSFYLSFCDREKISDKYLEARKSLYKSIISLKTSLQEQQIKENQRLSSMEYKEREKEKRGLQREQERKYTQEKPQVFEGDWGKIIFLDTEQNLSNLIHIHSNQCDIFTKMALS